MSDRLILYRRSFNYLPRWYLWFYNWLDLLIFVHYLPDRLILYWWNNNDLPSWHLRF